MDWENHLEKNRSKKLKKNIKNQSETAACEKKPTSERANFDSKTVFSLTLKLEQKKFYAAKPLAFFAPLLVSA